MPKRKDENHVSSDSKRKVRQYSTDYLKFGFISDVSDQTRPYCLLCDRSFCNDSMRPVKLDEHITKVHPEHRDKPLDYFKRLRDKSLKSKEQKLELLFKSATNLTDRGLQASYELSYLLGKQGRPHTDGEKLLKPAFEIYLRTMQESKQVQRELTALPLSNDTVRRRIDEIAVHLHSKLVKVLQKNKFSLALDETTVRHSECLLLVYARFQLNSTFVEEMLFCESLKTTSTAGDIYSVVKTFLDSNEIPISNIVSAAADGAPTMMGRRNGVLKLLKDDYPEMITVHCVLHRENLAAQGLTPELNDVMKQCIKVINFIKSHPKTERLFKVFCEEMNEDYVRLLLHTQVRWLSKGKCLERFVVLYDTIVEFGADHELFQFLKSEEARYLICYLADIFGKLNVLNEALQGSNKTMMDCKTKICGFISKLTFWRSQISRGNFSQFAHLSQYQVSDNAVEIINRHLSALSDDFNSRFSDLKSMKFPSWIAQPFLFDTDCDDIHMMNPDEVDDLLELRNDASMKAIHSAKGQLMWLDTDVNEKYPKLATEAQQTLLPFPTTYIVECAFSAVADLLTKKRGALDISVRGDLRVKLTSFSPDFSAFVSQHEAHGSH